MWYQAVTDRRRNHRPDMSDVDIPTFIADIFGYVIAAASAMLIWIFKRELQMIDSRFESLEKRLDRWEEKIFHEQDS